MSEFVSGASIDGGAADRIALAVQQRPITETHSLHECRGCGHRVAVHAGALEVARLVNPSAPVFCENCTALALALGFEP